MAVFDITDIVTGIGGHRDVFYRTDRFKNIQDLVAWLKENVGEYYGTGEDHTEVDSGDIRNNQGSSAIRIGKGWEIVRDWKGDPNGYVEVWWNLDITDDAKASFFALKWLK